MTVHRIHVFVPTHTTVLMVTITTPVTVGVGGVVRTVIWIQLINVCHTHVFVPTHKGVLMVTLTTLASAKLATVGNSVKHTSALLAGTARVMVVPAALTNITLTTDALVHQLGHLPQTADLGSQDAYKWS